MQGPGNLNSGAGVVDVSVIPANRAVSPIRVACQCPRKVSQVHNRGRVLLPWATAALSSPLTFSPTIMSTFDEWSFSFVSLENLVSCLFVSMSEVETNRERESDCAFQTVSAEPYWMGSYRLLFLYTKKLFCFDKEQLSFLQRLTQPCCCLEGCSHTQARRSTPKSESVSVTFV